jgi:endonuclease/exonuclease/phosphatase family metal-dependent hydrolase
MIGVMSMTSLRLAAYNVENLFSRPRAMNQSEPVAAEILRAHARVNELFQLDVYTDAVKAEILTQLRTLGLLTSDGNAADDDTMALLRKYRGQLLKRPRGDDHDVDEDDVIVVANGRADWTGWVELTKDRIDAKAIENTAEVIRLIGADIVGVVEAEDRPTLQRFSETLLLDDAAENQLYPHVMVIDGNDDRGIDVGVLSTEEYPIDSIRSHVDDGPVGKPVFSRDCPEYWFRFPRGSALEDQSLVVLVNHLKSKFGGNDPGSQAKRKAQANRVKEIYEGLRNGGVAHVAVLGDFNDTPDSDALSPLLHDTDLRDFVHVEPFDDGAPADDRPGTFGNGTKSNKIDYLLMSPTLFARATSARIVRLGVWGGVHGTLFPHLPTIENATQAASDHAAVVVDIDIG